VDRLGQARLQRRQVQLYRHRQVPLVVDRVHEALEPILWNRFGRNLRTKPNLVKFKSVIVTLAGFKVP
jgi:hypothetical protein